MRYDQGWKPDSRKIRKIIIHKFTPLLIEWGFLFLMIGIKELYNYFLRYPKISTDTRKDLRDSIFFALSGENFNGNLFAREALEKGARYAVIDDAGYGIGDKYLLVDDTLETMQELATLHRRNSSLKVLGITGTNGKTTTKELIASVLQISKNITFTSGNFNNHIGVPLSVLKIKKDTEIAVIEMGANHEGEIAQLCGIAQPDVGIITNIGKAHLEGFGSYEGVLRAKSELYDYLRDKKGKTIVNADDELLMRISEGMNRFSYGTGSADLLGQINSIKPTISLQWGFKDSYYRCKTNLFGKYNFNNVMAAIATGLFFGLSPENINKGIGSYVAKNNRSQQLKTESNNIYLDAYNANPVSMKEAILSFKEYSSDDSWLILGDMFELGKASYEEHSNIIRILEETNFRNVLLVGNEFYSLKKNSTFPVFNNLQDIGSYLNDHPIRNADILIKGSRGMMLESLLNKL